MTYYFIVAKEWCGIDSVEYKTDNPFDMIVYALNFIKNNTFFNEEERTDILNEFINNECQYVDDIFSIAIEEN